MFAIALLSPHFRDEETEAQRDTVACPTVWYLLVSFHKYLWSIGSRPQTGYGGLRDKEEEMAPTLREPLILKGRNKSAPLKVPCGGCWGHPSHSHLKLTCSFHYTHTHTHTLPPPWFRPPSTDDSQMSSPPKGEGLQNQLPPATQGMLSQAALLLPFPPPVCSWR